LLAFEALDFDERFDDEAGFEVSVSYAAAGWINCAAWVLFLMEFA